MAEASPAPSQTPQSGAAPSSGNASLSAEQLQAVEDIVAQQVAELLAAERASGAGAAADAQHAEADRAVEATIASFTEEGRLAERNAQLAGKVALASAVAAVAETAKTLALGSQDGVLVATTTILAEQLSELAGVVADVIEVLAKEGT